MLTGSGESGTVVCEDVPGGARPRYEVEGVEGTQRVRVQGARRTVRLGSYRTACMQRDTHGARVLREIGAVDGDPHEEDGGKGRMAVAQGEDSRGRRRRGLTEDVPQ